MIASLRGHVAATRPGAIVLDVGGVGYLVAATASADAGRRDADGGEITVHTHLHVREDTLQLYGFASTGERSLFELLLGVSGMGPKAALAIVSGYAPDQIRRAVATGDHALFTSIPGIGRRTAERVIVDLKDKVGSGRGRRRRAGRRWRRRPCRCRATPWSGLGMSVAEAEAALRPTSTTTSRSRSASGSRWPGRSRPGERMSATADPRIPDALVAPGEEEFDRSLRPRTPGRVHRPGADQGAARHLPRGRPPARRGPRPRAPRRARRAWARPRSPASSPPSWASALRITSGPALERKGDLAAILTALEPQRRPLHRRDPPPEPRRSRSCSTRRWRTSSSTSSLGQGPRRARCASTCSSSRSSARPPAPGF